MTVLGASAEAGVTALESIVEVLGEQPALVVIDNAEHVRDAVGELVTSILGGCEGVSIMVTSREPLDVPGESVHVVAPLDAFESIDLFCERAREADDSFEYGDDDRAVIEMIAARLDGLPLAIELAAARMRSLTTRDLLGRLDDRFSVLRRSGADSGRHATLHAAVDWSYRSLGDDERAVFDRLGVFAGGFDLGAVTAVCMGSGRASLDVADVVLSLVDKSMVVADRRQPVTRYWLLETLHEYALKRLAEGGLEAQARAAHIQYFNALAGEIRRSNEIDDGPPQATLQREWDNFRAATQWALDSGDIDGAASLAANLSMALDISRDEHQRWVVAVLEVLPENHRLAAVLYCLAGWWANLLGDHQEALRLAHRGLAVGTPRRQADLLGS
jgi:predicted ATPase